MRISVKAALPLTVAVLSTAYLPIAPAAAAELPPIKLSAANVVPQCTTPGRLTAFLEDRNGRLDPRFGTIAADYMRVGTELGIRWDYAFFQMLLETGNLTFKGDVSSSQNNFAGLGATGRGAKGERFADVPTGVKAHLQHVLMYSGETVAEPVAERTRKIQEWNVLTSWQNTFSRPIGFSDLARKWAPTSRRYTRDIEGIADKFYDGPCKAADPKPEMMALVHPEGAKAETTASLAKSSDAPSPADLARLAGERARESGTYVRSSLGAASLIADSANSNSAVQNVRILNADAANEPVEKIEVAAAAGNAAHALNAGQPKSKCNVWTASYGGLRAVIIKAPGDGSDNYTVLDVNEATASRETDAYIAAYAKGGRKIADFASPAAALQKAFELCPEE